MFAIQFLNTDEVWLMVKPTDIVEVSKFIETGKCEVSESMIENQDSESENKRIKKKIVGSSSKAREQMRKERELRYAKKTKSAI